MDLTAQVLIIDHQESAATLPIAEDLLRAGYFVTTARTGLEGVRKEADLKPDVILLELSLPDIDGLDVCKLVRSQRPTRPPAIVVVSGRTAENDRVLSLESGADDFIPKPANPRELILRIRNVLGFAAADAQREVLRIGELYVDVPGHSAMIGSSLVTLTHTEFRILAAMLRHCGSVLSRTQLLDEICPAEHQPNTLRSIDTHIRRLRRKLGWYSRYVRTVQGVGYQIVPR